MKLQNCTEFFVKQNVDHLLPKVDMCQCEICAMDIMALALNNLKPHYAVTEEGALFAQMREFDAQHKIDVMTAVIDAIEMVKKTPRHVPDKDQHYLNLYKKQVRTDPLGSQWWVGQSDLEIVKAQLYMKNMELICDFQVFMTALSNVLERPVSEQELANQVALIQEFETKHL